MRKTRVYLISAILLAGFAAKAQDFDPEAISQVSKAIAEEKLMSDSQGEGRQVYVSSTLGPKVERGTSHGVNAVIGLNAFGSDYTFRELEWQRRLMRSYDFRQMDYASYQIDELKRSLEMEKALNEAERTRSFEIGKALDQAQKVIDERERILKLIEKGLPRIYWTRNSWMTVDPIIAFDPERAELLTRPIWRARQPWPGSYDKRFDVIWMDPEALSEPAWAGSDPDGVLSHELGHVKMRELIGLSRDLEDMSAQYEEMHFDSERRDRFAVEDSIARDLKQKGYDVTVYPSYEEYRLDPKRYGLGYEIGKLESGSIIGPYGHRISIGGWNTSLQKYINMSVQQYYNRIGEGTSFYMPRYARPRTSYSTIGQRR